MTRFSLGVIVGSLATIGGIIIFGQWAERQT